MKAILIALLAGMSAALAGEATAQSPSPRFRSDGPDADADGRRDGYTWTKYANGTSHYNVIDAESKQAWTMQERDFDAAGHPTHWTIHWDDGHNTYKT
jgi:hypothetical protein